MPSDVDSASGPRAPFVIDKVAHSNTQESTYHMYIARTQRSGAYIGCMQLEWKEFNTDHCQRAAWPFVKEY